MARQEVLPALSMAEQRREGRFGHTLLRASRRQPLAAIGAAILLLALMIAIAAPVLAPYSYDVVGVGRPLQGPSAEHLMGTDQLGRDILSRVIYGTRVAMVVGFSVVAVSIVLAFVVGVGVGFIGGLPDLIIQRLIDALQAMPGLILTLALVAFVGRELHSIIIIIGIILVPGMSRVMRSATIGVKAMPFIEGARAVGATNFRLFFWHIIPNVISLAIIYGSLVIGSAIIAEGSLSFLGYGLEPPTPTWGGMLGVEGRRSLLLNPWLVVFPAAALSLVVLGANMLGDGLRDLLDPRLRRGR